MVSWTIVRGVGRKAWYSEVSKKMSEGYVLHPESFSTVINSFGVLNYSVLMSK